jgi:hypothetical protein
MTSILSNKSSVKTQPTSQVLSLFVRVLLATSYPTGNRLNRSSAVLVGFYFAHSFPNLLLLSSCGKRRYSDYASHHRLSVLTRLIEFFLLGAGIVHSITGFRRAVQRRGGDQFMVVSGLGILGLMMTHLQDFRFADPPEKIPLSDTVTDTIRFRRFRYTLFVLLVAGHSWRGVSAGWLYRLGFRDPVENRCLLILTKFLIAISTLFYSIPIISP